MWFGQSVNGNTHVVFHDPKSFCDAKESRCRAATSTTAAKEPGAHRGGKIRIFWSCDM